MCGVDVDSFRLEKRAVFFSGEDMKLKSVIRDILSIPEGSLPVMHLGLLPISTRLSSKDYTSLKHSCTGVALISFFLKGVEFNYYILL